MNDDQSSWALAALTAAERGFAAPRDNLTWNQVASNVFDNQIARWETKLCKGGLRWGLFPYQSGYAYKNTLANAQLFVLSARLAHNSLSGSYNETYANWAEKTYDWMNSSGIIDSEDGSVFDGLDSDCNISRLQWSNNAGAVTYGTALMAKTTNDTKWLERGNAHLTSIVSTFLSSDGVLIESACESNGKCNADMLYYKGTLAQQLTRTAILLESTDANNTLLPVLRDTAQAAAETGCKKASNCTFAWTSDSDEPRDGVVELGSQYSALQSVQQLLAFSAPNVTNTSSSSGTQTSGSGSQGSNSPSQTSNSPSASTTGAAATMKVPGWSVGGFVGIATFAFAFALL